MPQVIWARPALRDLERVRDFLHARSPRAARKAVDAIREGLRMLEHFPAAGRPVAGLDPSYREIPIDFGDGGYVIRYRFEGDVVLIARLRHMREAGF